MLCSKCQFENREGVKFCAECGNKLKINCSKCSYLNPPSSKFCEECGSRLNLLSEQAPLKHSLDEKISNIQKYLPKGLTEKILSQRDKIEGERKQVTIMFCDMEGFTPLTENLGPEETFSLMDQVFKILIHKVHDYGGIINELRGDGVLALFGAPIALEDAPQRAIRSALAIQQEMINFNKKTKGEIITAPIMLRIGINTGPVIIGTMGNNLRLQFTAMGDTINMASRIEYLAEPGTIYVTEDTFKLTEGFFRFEALGEKEIKGKDKPIKAYQVIAPTTMRTKFDVRAERGLTHYVGRKRELEVLLRGFERAKAGRGMAFSIVGEAGVGKSRLLYEFRKAVANEDIIFLEGKCLSYSRGVAYHPFIDILKSIFDMEEVDSDSEIKEKVKKGLQIFGPDEVTTLPCLLELFSVKDSGIDKIPTSLEAIKDRIIEALKEIILKSSEIHPLIIAIEDLHWIDKSSEDVSKQLIKSILESRVLLIFTYRPELVHPWGGKPFHSQVTINRLSVSESPVMISYVLGDGEPEKDLEALILEKTEGIPFFIEEFIRYLKDLKIIDKKDKKYHLTKGIQDMNIPSTIQGMIMARVDALPEGSKEVLQSGSVIEREFSFKMIERVTELPEQELLSYLSTLMDSELLYETGIYPYSTYVFKHALTREVVYDSILTKKRKRLHEKAGNAIETLCKENMEEQYGVLAEHYRRSGNYEKGAYFSLLASKKAAKTGSINDATSYTEKRIACLERLSQTDEVKIKIVDTRTVLGLYYTQINYHAEAREVVEPIINIAIEQDYMRRLAQIFTIMGAYYGFVQEPYPDAFENLERAIKISEKIGDTVTFVLANFFLAVTLSINCEFERAVRHFKIAHDINAAANSLWSISGIKSSLAFFVYYFQGQIGQAFQTSTEAMRIAEESGDIYSKVMSFVSQGISCYGRGLLEEARDHLLIVIDLCERIKYHLGNWLAQMILGEICFEVKDYQSSLRHYKWAVGIIEDNRWAASWLNLSKMGAARAKMINNKRDIDLNSFYICVDETKFKIYEGWIRRYVAETLLYTNDQHISEAEGWVKKAIEADQSNCMMWQLGKDYALFTELFKRKGEKSKAKENLEKSIEIFNECGADGWVEKYEKELAEL